MERRKWCLFPDQFEYWTLPIPTPFLILKQQFECQNRCSTVTCGEVLRTILNSSTNWTGSIFTAKKWCWLQSSSPTTQQSLCEGSVLIAHVKVLLSNSNPQRFLPLPLPFHSVLPTKCAVFPTVWAWSTTRAICTRNSYMVDKLYLQYGSHVNWTDEALCCVEKQLTQHNRTCSVMHSNPYNCY